MRKIFVFVALMLVSVALVANGLSLNSVGTKALSMGGAYVGLADDGTAIYWNPAGLIGQDNAVKLNLTDVVPFSSYKADGADYGYPATAFNIDAETEWKDYINPNLFANYNLGNKIAMGFGVFVPAGLGAEYDGKDLAPLAKGNTSIEWKSKIGVVNFSPALAYKLNDRFSVGVSGNVYYGMFELKRAAVIDTVAFQYSEESNGIGLGATIGMKYKLNEVTDFGFTLRTPTKVTLSGTAENPGMQVAQAPTKSDFDRDVTWPMWIAGGFAFQPNEKLTLTLDAQWSEWKEVDEFSTDFDDAAWKQITAASGDDKFVLNWENKVQYRIGMEYQATPCMAVRGGWYYDPAPAPDETLNILFPSSTNSVLTGGLAYTKGKFLIELAGEYLFGVERNVAAADHNMPGTHEMDVLAASIGLGYNF